MAKMIYTSTKRRRHRFVHHDTWTTGRNPQRINNDALGYDGGAVGFSPDGDRNRSGRASRPKTETEIRVCKELLAEGLVAPTNMEAATANADGKQSATKLPT